MIEEWKREEVGKSGKDKGRGIASGDWILAEVLLWEEKPKTIHEMSQPVFAYTPASSYCWLGLYKLPVNCTP